MADKFDKKFEKNELPDSSERLNENEKIESGLHELQQKSHDMLTDRIYEVNTDIAHQEAVASQFDLKSEIREEIVHQENLNEQSDSIQNEKRIVQKIDNKKSGTVFSPVIQQSIAENSEDPMSIPGRQKSFVNVQSFTDAISQEGGFFGRIVKYLS